MSLMTIISVTELKNIQNLRSISDFDRTQHCIILITQIFCRTASICTACFCDTPPFLGCLSRKGCTVAFFIFPTEYLTPHTPPQSPQWTYSCLLMWLHLWEIVGVMNSCCLLPLSLRASSTWLCVCMTPEHSSIVIFCSCGSDNGKKC